MTVAELIFKRGKNNHERGCMAFSQALKLSVAVYQELCVFRFVFIDASVLVDRYYYGDTIGNMAVER